MPGSDFNDRWRGDSEKHGNDVLEELLGRKSEEEEDEEHDFTERVEKLAERAKQAQKD